MNIQSALFRDYLNQHRVLQHKSVMDRILQLEESLRQTNELLEFSEHFSRCGTDSNDSNDSNSSHVDSSQPSEELSGESLYFFPRSKNVQPSFPVDPLFSPLMQLERNIQQLTEQLQGTGYHSNQSPDEDKLNNRMQTDSPSHSPQESVEPSRSLTDSPDLVMLGLVSGNSAVGGPTNADGQPIPLNDLSTSSIASLASSVSEDSDDIPILSAALYPPNSPSPHSPSFRTFFPTPLLATLRHSPSPSSNNGFSEEKDNPPLISPRIIQNPPSPESGGSPIIHSDLDSQKATEFPADSLDSSSSSSPMIHEVEVSSPHHHQMNSISSSLTPSSSAPLLSEVGVGSPSTPKRMLHSSRSPEYALRTLDSGDEKKKPRFRCQYPGCNKTYTAKFSLKRHEKKHTGEKLFVCNHASHANQNHQPEGGCGKSFPEKWRLKRHQKHLNLGKGTI
jgi:hypothetical protein